MIIETKPVGVALEEGERERKKREGLIKPMLWIYLFGEEKQHVLEKAKLSRNVRSRECFSWKYLTQRGEKKNSCSN